MGQNEKMGGGQGEGIGGQTVEPEPSPQPQFPRSHGGAPIGQMANLRQTSAASEYAPSLNIQRHHHQGQQQQQQQQQQQRRYDNISNYSHGYSSQGAKDAVSCSSSSAVSSSAPPLYPQFASVAAAVEGGPSPSEEPYVASVVGQAGANPNYKR